MDPSGREEAVQQAGQEGSGSPKSKPLVETSGTRSRDEMLEENVIGTLARGFRVTVSGRRAILCTADQLLPARTQRERDVRACVAETWRRAHAVRHARDKCGHSLRRCASAKTK